MSGAWHESRRMERVVKGMIVDYQKRAERRRNYYEKTKLDPVQFLQVHGRPARIHLDAAVAQAADGPNSMMSWQGDAGVLIDRFDGRAHLDCIPEVRSAVSLAEADGLSQAEADQINFERYRILVQNDFAGLSEEKFLREIHLEEQYGSTILLQQAQRRDAELDKRRLADSKAAIGYNYDESEPRAPPPPPEPPAKPEPEPDADSDDDDDDIDLDMALDLEQLTTDEYSELNSVGRRYSLSVTGFMDLLVADQEEQETARIAKLEEEQKQALSGKKGRKERRLLKERKLLQQKPPVTMGRAAMPSYARPVVPTAYVALTSAHVGRRLYKSRSRSRSPPVSAKVEFITTFGHDSDSDGEAPTVAGPPAPGPVNQPLPNAAAEKVSSAEPCAAARPRSEREAERGKDRNRTDSRRRTRSRSRERPRDYDRVARRRRTPSRSRSRSRDRLRRPGRFGNPRRRSRSPRERRRSRSRSRSRRSNSRSRRSRSRSRRSRSRSLKSLVRNEEAEANGKKRNQLPAMPDTDSAVPARLPTPPVKRYYGRRRSVHSSDSSALSDDDEGAEQTPAAAEDARPAAGTAESSPSSTSGRSAGAVNFPSQPAANKAGPLSKLTPQEKLKLKMQRQLQRQYKADKKAAQNRAEKQEQELWQRQAELRSISSSLRRKERERRRAEHGKSSSSDSDDSHNSGTPPPESYRTGRDARKPRDQDNRVRDTDYRRDGYRVRERDRRAEDNDDRRAGGGGPSRYSSGGDRRRRQSDDSRRTYSGEERYPAGDPPGRYERDRERPPRGGERPRSPVPVWSAPPADVLAAPPTHHRTAAPPPPPLLPPPPPPLCPDGDYGGGRRGYGGPPRPHGHRRPPPPPPPPPPRHYQRRNRSGDNPSYPLVDY